MTTAFTSEEMNRLTDGMKDAIVEVVVAGVLANGSTSEARLAKCEAELRKVPWGRTEDDMLETVKDAFSKIDSFTTVEQAVGLVKHAAQTIPEPAIREKTFALLARVMYMGKPLDEKEKTVLAAFVMGFELDRARVQEIVDEVKKDV